MSNLSTNYLGMTLKNPVVVSPSPQSEKIDNIKKMEEAGAAAVVLHSLFEEQLTLQSQELNANLMQGADSFAEALSYFPEADEYKMGPEGYLEHVRRAKEAVSIPIIGSLNGVSSGGWVDFAQRIEEAGADALELNVYFIPTNMDMHDAAISEQYEALVRDVKAAIKIPVAVKVGPYFNSMANMAKRLDMAGANALVMFNRFYQPDFDLDKFEVVPNLKLSDSTELTLRLRWAAILYSRIKADIAITGGVHTAEDVAKAILAGANVTMMTSALLKNGIGHITTVLSKLAEWMERKEYESVAQMRGSMSQKSVAEPAAFERANYMQVLGSYTASM